MWKSSLISVGLAVALATPMSAQADETRSNASPMARSSSSPMAGHWSSAMPASDQIFGPSLGTSPMGRDGTRVKNRHRRHEGAASAVNSGRDAASASTPFGATRKTDDNPGAKATGWGTGAAGGLAGGHNP